MQHIPGTQGAATVAAELAQGEGAARSQIRRTLNAAGNGKVSTGSFAGHLAQLQGLARLYGNDGITGNRVAIERRLHVCTGEGDAGGLIKFQGRAVERELQPRRLFLVAQQTIAQAKTQGIERTGRRYAHRPVTTAPGVVLHRGQSAAGQHVQSERLVAEVVQVAGGHLAVGKHRVGKNAAQVITIAFDAFDTDFFQILVQCGQRCVAAGFMNNHLGQHGVEQGRNGEPGFDPVINTQGLAVGLGKGDGSQQAGAGLEILVGILCVQSCLDGMAAHGQVGGQAVQRGQLTGGQFQHPLHQVHAVNLFGDAVLYLQAGIHFQKIKGVAVLVENEFHGAGVTVADCFHQCFGGGLQFAANRVGQVGCGGFFQHFLVATLGGTVALAEGDRVALAITENLHFDMAGTGDIFFDKNAIVGKVVGAQSAHGIPGLVQAGGAFTDLHADAATTGGTFQHHRVADLVCRCQGRLLVGEKVGTGEKGNAGVFRQSTSGMFQAEGVHLLRCRADEGYAAGFAALHKIRVLTEKPIARVHRLDAVLFHQGKQGILIQIGVAGTAFTQTVSLVGLCHMQGIPVRFGIDGHGGNAEIFQGGNHTGGNGAAVGNQHFVEHDGVSLTADGSSRHGILWPPGSSPGKCGSISGSRSTLQWVWGCSRCRGC